MKTTTKHFKLFKKHILHYAKVYGLNDWRIEIDHTKNNDNIPTSIINRERAGFEADLETMLVVFRQDTEWDITPTEEELKNHAYHEIVELVLERLVYYAEKRACGSSERRDIEEATHQIVRRFKNAHL